MVTIDYVIIAISAVFFVFGLIYGLLDRVLTFFGILAGLVLGGVFCQPASVYLETIVEDQIMRYIVTYIILAFGISAVLGIIKCLLNQIVKRVKFLKFLDVFLGGVFNVAIVYVVICAIISVNGVVVTALDSASQSISVDELSSAVAGLRDGFLSLSQQIANCKVVEIVYGSWNPLGNFLTSLIGG